MNVTDIPEPNDGPLTEEERGGLIWQLAELRGEVAKWKEAANLASAGTIAIREQLMGTMEQMRHELLNLTLHASEQQSANRRASAALVQTLRALRRCVQIMRLIGKAHVPDRFGNGWHTALAQAEEVIALHDIPF